MVEKLEKDGFVAVIVSGGYGAGWSTWAGSDIREQVMFDPEVAQMILDGKDDNMIAEFAEKKYGDDFYTGGADGLRVRWVKKGDVFTINEYDGAESIRFRDADYDWTTA